MLEGVSKWQACVFTKSACLKHSESKSFHHHKRLCVHHKRMLFLKKKSWCQHSPRSASGTRPSLFFMLFGIVCEASRTCPWHCVRGAHVQLVGLLNNKIQGATRAKKQKAQLLNNHCAPVGSTFGLKPTVASQKRFESNFVGKVGAQQNGTCNTELARRVSK